MAECPDIPPKAVVEFAFGESDGQFWLYLIVDRVPHHSEPFDTPGERQRAYDDLLQMMRQQGAIDLPGLMQ